MKWPIFPLFCTGRQIPTIRAIRQAGEGVFHERRCFRCHSIRQSGGRAAPELSTYAIAVPVCGRAIRDGGTLPLLLQGDEEADLHSFLASLRYFESSGSALVGERVSQSAVAHTATVQMHGARSSGLSSDPAPRPSRPFPSLRRCGGMGLTCWTAPKSRARSGRFFKLNILVTW